MSSVSGLSEPDAPEGSTSFISHGLSHASYPVVVSPTISRACLSSSLESSDDVDSGGSHTAGHDGHSSNQGGGLVVGSGAKSGIKSGVSREAEDLERKEPQEQKNGRAGYTEGERSDAMSSSAHEYQRRGASDRQRDSEAAAWAGLRRRLFPRLLALRVAFPQWDDHGNSGRWHTDYILAKATSQTLEDYRAILAVVPVQHLYPRIVGSTHDETAAENKQGGLKQNPMFTSTSTARTAICVLQALDVLRSTIDGSRFTPINYDILREHIEYSGAVTSHPSQRRHLTESPMRAQTESSRPPRNGSLRTAQHKADGIALPLLPHQSPSHSPGMISADERVVQAPSSTRYQRHDAVNRSSIEARGNRGVRSARETMGTIKTRQIPQAGINRGVVPSENRRPSVSSVFDTIPVDYYFPLRESFHVFRWGESVWSAHLRRVTGSATTEVFLMQLLEKNVEDAFFFICRWGCEERGGNSSYRKVDGRKEGCKLFEETFRVKTGNRWDRNACRTLVNFSPVAGKYILIDDLPESGELSLPL